jgi:hypothetical protein
MPTQVEEARIRADFLNTPPTIDGNLSDWSLTSTPVQNVVFGADNRQSNADLSGSVMVGWTTDALYLAGHVRDDKYVQNAHGSNLYLGDSLEILFDRDLAGDQTNHNLTGDDYQLGISPGSPGPGDNPEAYLWYPQRGAGKVTDIDSAFVPTDKGYDFEMKIPWSVFGATITGGERFGFGFSISDNDRANANVQQSMVSNVNTRLLVDPTTWGLLRVVKP